MPRDQSEDIRPTLIFIPDISGFTRFVNENEITHSRHIIEELLEVIIDANDIGLEISEIEGDAILFYRQGPTPTAAELLAQVQKMYTKFHAHLKRYDAFRICQCGACSAASGLTLKFVLHFGALANKQVKQFTKLFGKELIVAHRLLKNNIEIHEYALVTHKLINECEAWVEFKQVSWGEIHESSGNYDGNSVNYCFISLAPLAARVPEPEIIDYSVKASKTLGAHIEAMIDAPLETVFSIVSDVTTKHLWVDGVKASAELNGLITRNGSTHRCVMSETEADPFFYSHNFTVDKDVVTWTDSDHKAKMNMVIRLERIDKQLTRISYNVLIPGDIISRIMFRIKAKKMLINWITGNFRNLNEFCKSLEMEKSQPQSQIVFS